MSGSRALVLERLRAAQRTGRVPTVAVPPPLPAPPAEDLVERFLRELSLLGVECHREESAEAVRGRVATLVAGRRVFAWDPGEMPYGLGDVLEGAATGGSPREAQAAAEVGVTGCDAAVAETGSLVLLSAPGRPRAASLLPLVHVAVVRTGDLVATMGDFFAASEGRLAAASACTFVTGPSRTADIELVLTLGVHGPGQVQVVLGP